MVFFLKMCFLQSSGLPPPLLFPLVLSFYRPLLSVDEDLTASDVHPVPSQSQTQLVGSGSVGTWEWREVSEKVRFRHNAAHTLFEHCQHIQFIKHRNMAGSFVKLRLVDLKVLKCRNNKYRMDQLKHWWLSLEPHWYLKSNFKQHIIRDPERQTKRQKKSLCAVRRQV